MLWTGFFGCRIGVATKVTRSRTSGSRLRRWAQPKAATVARTRKAKTRAAGLPRRRGIVLADHDRHLRPRRGGLDFRAHQVDLRDPQLLGDLARFRRVAAFEHDHARFEALFGVGDGAEVEALVLDFVAVAAGEAFGGGAVKDRDLDFARLDLRRRLLAPLAAGAVIGAADDDIGDTADDHQHDDEDRDQVARLGEAGAQARGAVAEAFAATLRRQSRLAAAAAFLALADRLVLRGAGLVQLAQLLRPPGGDRRGRLLALGIALGCRAGPLAQAPNVPALREREQGEHGEPDERGQAGEGADLFNHLKQAARDYSPAATAAASLPGEAISSTTRSARFASSPASTRCSSEASVEPPRAGSSAWARPARLIRRAAVGRSSSLAPKSSSCSFSPGRG